MTKFAAIPLLGVGLTLAGFGVIRGAMDAGPGAGTRLVLGIAPPVDEDVREMAVHIAKERVEEKGAETRVVPAGDRIVGELDTTDPELVKDTSDLLGRTARVELHVVMPNDAWPAADYVANDDQAKRLGIHVAMGALLAEDRENDLPVAEADAIGCRGRAAGRRDGEHAAGRTDRDGARWARQEGRTAARGDGSTDAAPANDRDRRQARGRCDPRRDGAAVDARGWRGPRAERDLVDAVHARDRIFAARVAVPRARADQPGGGVVRVATARRVAATASTSARSAIAITTSANTSGELPPIFVVR